MTLAEIIKKKRLEMGKPFHEIMRVWEEHKND